MDVWLVFVVPLYQGKGGEGQLACDVMRISHRDQNRKHSDRYRQGRVTRGRINWKAKHTDGGTYERNISADGREIV
jgi:hypothetical protein